MIKSEQPIQINQIEALTAKYIASDKANAAKWGINSVIALFGILVTVVILIARQIDTTLVGGLAVVGLLTIWFIAWRNGKKLFSRFYLEELSNSQIETDEIITSKGSLSKREIQVLNYAAKGFSNKQIGLELGISIHTVKIFISSSMVKLEANDRTQAVVQAIKRGIISI
ncbi:response regulator transcription factor [Chloroflexota bacterium]